MKKQQKPVNMLWLFLLVVLTISTLKAQPNYKAGIVDKVFNDLNNTFGEYRGKLKVELVKDRNPKEPLIALYRPQDNKILISEELYDLCRTLKADSLNALAVILGHELSHHYLKHTWHETYGFSKPTPGVTNKDKQKLESEADFNGCYAAQLAGYYTQTAFPNIIDAIYTKFKLPENINEQYPIKRFRKETYIEKSKELQRLVSMYRMGQILYSSKSFEKAAACFEYISNHLPSPEVLNNKAACLIQDYLQRQPYTRFILPIEFDVVTRLREKPKSRGLEEVIEAQRLLEKALGINPDYELARINLACSYILTKNYAAAIGEINKIEKPSADALTARAIAYFEDGQKDRALADFESASRTNGEKYQKNLELFNQFSQYSLSWLKNSYETVSSWVDDILSNYYSSNRPVVMNIPESGFNQFISTSESFAVAVPLMATVKIKTNELGLYKILYDKSIFWFMDSTFNGKSKRGVGVGDTEKTMIKKYGNQYKTYPLFMGIEEYIYTLKNDQKLIFVLQDKKIIQWALILKQ
ncbi:hypothetical protein [Emticicia fontis]